MCIRDRYSAVLIPRSNWSSKAAKACPKRLRLPVTKIYIRETTSANCDDYSWCKTLLSSTLEFVIYAGYNDIQTNFVITGDGLIFEGLSWSCKVEDNRVEDTAILVSLTGNSEDKSSQINLDQYDSLKLFLIKNVFNDGNINSSYQILPYCCIVAGKNPGKFVYSNLTLFDKFSGDGCLKCRYYRLKD